MIELSITITPEFQSAFDLLEQSSQNVLLTGKAGTGKSTFLRYFRSHTKKRIAVVAPTGIAALNVQGQTIHSFFRFPPRFVNLNEIKSDYRKIFKNIDLLIIDEISMVRADVFDGIDHFLKVNRHSPLPFGGVQVCLIGDLFQLPPVVTNDERAFFAQYYTSPFFFETQAYKAAYFELVEFQDIHRQSDAEFIHLLNSIRSGQCGAHHMGTLNKQVHTEDPSAGTIVLTATNAVADEINAARLSKLPGETKVYAGELKGQFGLTGARLPAPDQLALKVGAQIMFVKNSAKGNWVNGTIGVVERLDPETITVRTEDGAFEVTSEKWQTVGYEFDDKKEAIVEKALGSYSQFPIMLAWAITIHKSQGKTLSHVVIDLGRGAFAPGQLYVALSRCPRLEHISLKKAITQRDIQCDSTVIDFMNSQIKPF